MDAGRKGIAWLQKEVESMGRDELRKVAAAAGLSTRRHSGGMVPVDELRKMVVKHFSPQAICRGRGVWFVDKFA